MKKKAQLDFYQELARQVNPDQNRRAPRIWFQHVAILRKLDPAKENEIRRIPLKRGLNILWAPPERADAEVRMYEDGISGHASGKTLFCRLLRYLLGEQNFANDALVEAIADKFPELWVLAEVFVGEQLWLVVRPMTGSSHKFAVRGITIDDYLREKRPRENFDDYLHAVEEATCGAIEGREEANELFRWRYLLPWITRDQECRFASLTDWRSTLSGAERPQINVADQQLLIRAALGVLKPEEQRLKRSIEAIEAVLESDREALPNLERQWKRDWGQWLNQLRPLDISPEMPIEEAELDGLENRVTRVRDGIQEAIDLANQDTELKRTQGEWQKKRDKKIRTDAQVEALRRDVEDLETRLKELSSKRQTRQQQGLKDPRKIEEGYCPNTLAEAVRRGCAKAPTGSSIETDISLGDIQSEADILKGFVEQRKRERARLESTTEQLEAAVKAAWDIYQAEQTRVDNATKGFRQKLQRVTTALDRFSAVKESFVELSVSQARTKSNNESRDQLKGQLETYLQEHTPTEQYTSDLFADIIRAVMGSQIRASAALTDRGITLKAERNGDLHGAALETIKVLAFDIAAMATSIEGKGHHPRFLIHDGPRESDMARVIYERFFLYAKKLEESLGDKDAASFQYIITTTTPPPKDMQRGSPWLLEPVLDGAKKDGKLLTEDF